MEHKTKPLICLNYFVGIDFPDHVKEEISVFIKHEMNDFNQTLNFIDPSEYHITIAYLGKITQEQRERLIQISDQIKFPPFAIEIQGFGFFPKGNNPKTLWIGIRSGREQMNVFSNKVRDEIAARAGLLARNIYFPHAVVANIRDRTDKSKLYDFIAQNWDYPFGAFQVKSFHLYRITKNGYQRNHEVKLKNDARLIIE